MKKIIVICIILGFIGTLYYWPILDRFNQKLIKVVEKDQLSFGIHPYLEEKSLISKFQPLVEYLGKAINKKIILQISPSYSEHLKRVGSDYYDFSYIGPTTYIEMVEKYDEKHILASMTTYDLPYFNGIIFVLADSTFYDLNSLKGQSVAFGKESSTMSSVIPKIMLKEEGVELNDLGSYQHLSNHEEVVKQVLSGKYAAGAVKESIYDKNKYKGLRQIARSRHVSEHVFIASNNMQIQTRDKIEHLLLTLTDKQEGKQILFNIKPKSRSLKHTEDYNFNSLREYLDINTRFKWDFKGQQEQLGKAANP
jgi:phosphonate transport system substrate-binding protein